MAAARALLAIAVLLLGCWLAFFGRDWDASPPLGPIAVAVGPPQQLPVAEPGAVLPSPPPATGQALAAVEAAPRTAGADFAPTHVISAAALNLRERPTSASPSVRSYPRGTPVVVSDRSNNWLRVVLEDGATGWMFARYLAAAPRDPGASG